MSDQRRARLARLGLRALSTQASGVRR
jgi:hypothetical protein